MSWVSALRTRLRLLFREEAAEMRMNEEIEFHIDMETDRLLREEKLSPAEARRRALVTFGGVTQTKEALRDGRGLAWLGGLSLDFKLGFRMLRKYPGLTIVGGLAMAFGIWVGAVVFEIVREAVSTTLPLPESSRIVHLRNWDVDANRAETRLAHDFVAWRQALSSVTDLGAWRDASLNLIGSDGNAHAVEVAEITAVAFRIAPERPMMGRVLAESDEQPGAPPVVVLGHDVWRTRFNSDPNILGRAIQVGEIYPTVVGVMPHGYAFPIAHDAWMPLKSNLLVQQPREGPRLTVFGRLAAGVTMERAQAELTMLGQRAAAEQPQAYEHLRPSVAPYATVFKDVSASDFQMVGLFNFFAIMLVVLVCGNVSLLMFARAATRETELAVRSALGASRSRIVTQLFTEALVLGVVAAAVGLGAAQIALQQWGVPFLEENLGRLPFWYDLRLSLPTVLYAIGLTVLGAVISGVLPALKITRGLGARLKQATAGGGGVQFGGIWTAIIIIQVAFTVAFPGVLFIEQQELLRIQSYDVGFAAGEFLGAQLDAEATPVTGLNADSVRMAQGRRFGASLEELRRRVLAEPGVTGVTFVDRLPRMFHRELNIEVDTTGGAAAQEPREVSTAAIDPNYFQVLESPILAGRAFNSADLDPDAHVAIVDQAFVDQVLHGRNAIGQRVRFASIPGRYDVRPNEPWFEIVGVVKELGMTFVVHRHRAAGVYVPTDLKNLSQMHMMVHTKGDPMVLAPRIREITTVVDPTIRLSNLQRVDEVSNTMQWLLRLWLKVTFALTGIALLLSLAGIYAVLSFIVARRTREIGVRVALGASASRVVTAIFRRPLTQVAIGVLAGGVIVTAGAFILSNHVPDQDLSKSIATGGLSLIQVSLLVAYAGLMFAVCLLACIVPTRRALGVQPIEALRAE